MSHREKFGYYDHPVLNWFGGGVETAAGFGSGAIAAFAGLAAVGEKLLNLPVNGQLTFGAVSIVSGVLAIAALWNGVPRILKATVQLTFHAHSDIHDRQNLGHH